MKTVDCSWHPHPARPILSSLSAVSLPLPHPLTANKHVCRNKTGLNLAHGVQLGRLRTELRDVTRSLKIVKEQLQVRSIVGNEESVGRKPPGYVTVLCF